MKLLVDTSFSLLLSLLLAQLPLLTSTAPHNHRRVYDLEKLTNQTRNLLKLTQDLLGSRLGKKNRMGVNGKSPQESNKMNDHVLDTEIEHRIKSLPDMTNRPSDLSSLKLKETLPKILVDLQSFELHFEWLSRASRKHKHAALLNVAKLGDLISHIKTFSASLQRQMLRVDAPRLPSPTPALPPLPAAWDMVQSSLELFQRFCLFCDWATRALLTLKSKN